MLLDKKQLFYEHFLVLDHALMLVLVILHEQHSFFYDTDCIQACCTYLISIFSGKNGKSLCKSCDSL